MYRKNAATDWITLCRLLEFEMEILSMASPEPVPAIAIGASDVAFRAAVAALDQSGFACIEGAVSQHWLDQARRQVRDEIGRHGKKFFSLIRPADTPDSVFAEVAYDPALTDLLTRLVLHACPQAAIEQDGPYNVLRVIAGRTGDDGAYQFHYDSSVITAVVPIFIPERSEGPAGQLAVFANRRPLRRTVLGNLIEKITVQNRFAWQRARHAVSQHPEGHIRQLQPGNIYLFWGYRTYHGNLPCGVDALRTTMLLHLGDPHGTSLVTRAIRALRARTEQRRRAG